MAEVLMMKVMMTQNIMGQRPVVQRQNGHAKSTELLSQLHSSFYFPFLFLKIVVLFTI